MEEPLLPRGREAGSGRIWRCRCDPRSLEDEGLDQVASGVCRCDPRSLGDEGLECRFQEIPTFEPLLLRAADDVDPQLLLIFDLRERNVKKAHMSMLRTVFIVFELAGGPWSSRRTQTTWCCTPSRR